MSFGRLSEIQQVAFDIRALIMINEGMLNYTIANQTYFTSGDF